MAVLFYLPNAAPVASGSSYPGAKLYFYLTGTSTSATVYTDDGLTTAHANPVVADSSGVFDPIYLDSSVSYRVVLKTSAGVTLRDTDPFPAAFSNAESVGEVLWPRTDAEIAASVTPSNYQFPPLDIRRYGAVSGENSTVAIQSAISVLGTSGGTITAGAGETYTVTSTIAFAGVGNAQAARVLDLNGSTVSWAGSTSTPIIKIYDNRYVTLRNFTVDGNDISGSVGVFVDSLQPLGSDHVNLDNFIIRNCAKGILLGSVGDDQNRVSDCTISNFLIEACTTGIETNSTNVDSILIQTGIISGCTDHILLTRAGFLSVHNITGYGGIESADTHFIRIAGPTDQLNVINCQAEDGGFTPFYFLKRTDYTEAVNSPINLIGCAADNDIVFAAGEGSGAVVNVIGGYFNDLDVLANDLNVNLIGARQKTGSTMTVNATNPYVRRFGANLSGTATITSGFYEDISANGYCTLPNGLLMQWGIVTPASLSATTSRADTITFDKTFPNAVLNVSVSAIADVTTNVRAWVKSATASGAVANVRNDDGSAQTIGLYWQAIGY